MEERFTRWLDVGYRYARQSGLCHSAAEDCAAEFMEFMLQVSRRQQEEKTEIANVCAWEYTCARRFALNYCRAEHRHEQTCDWQELAQLAETGMLLVCSHKPEEPIDFAARHEFYSHLVRSVNALPHFQREVFVRHHLQDESVQEVAVVLHKTPGAIVQTLWRARQRVRALMQEHHAADSHSSPPRMVDDEPVFITQRKFQNICKIAVSTRMFQVSYK